MRQLIKVICISAFLSAGSSKANELPTADQSLQPLPNFELGGFIQAGKPGQFSPAPAGTEGNGIGFGYGFNFGWRPISYLTIGAYVHALFHSVDIPSTSNNEYASIAVLGLNAKAFPLGPREPRLYALLGFSPLANYWIHDKFTIIPSEGEGATYRGYEYSFGAGYEYSPVNRLVLFSEFQLSRTTLTKRTIAGSPSVDLSTPYSRWSPVLRVGAMATF